MARFVADHTRRYPSFPTPLEKEHRPGKRVCIAHPRAVHLALKSRPRVFFAGTAQVIPHALLAPCTLPRHEVLLYRDAPKHGVILDDRVVEVNADYQVCASLAPTVSTDF